MIYLEPRSPVEMQIQAIHPFDDPVTFPANESSRARKLRAWIDSQITLASTSVAVPESDLKLSIYQPTPDSRTDLFKQARKSKDRQLPFWSDIWPSGLAMASVALQRADELQGRRVLELGSGLGTTAAATLKAGASVIALDYSPLPLALCRYNALANAERSPGALPANWREPRRSTLTRLEAAGPFPIIMAADVLYESRDIEPLMRMIDRLLAPDGQLWLSEPQRKVAARFLDTLALSGWRFTTQAMTWTMPDTGPTTVNIHFLRRELISDRPFSAVGGWRV